MQVLWSHDPRRHLTFPAAQPSAAPLHPMPANANPLPKKKPPPDSPKKHNSRPPPPTDLCRVLLIPKIPGESGERGIRTLGTLIMYTRFPVVFLKPLGHLSSRNPLRNRERQSLRAQPNPVNFQLTRNGDPSIPGTRRRSSSPARRTPFLGSPTPKGTDPRKIDALPFSPPGV